MSTDLSADALPVDAPSADALPVDAPSADAPSADAAAAAAFDLDGAWRLHPQVSIRPERFGALLYHFGTRRLSFLKSPTLLSVVRGLDAADSARAACAAAGVGEADLTRYRTALSTLASSQTICPRSPDAAAS